MVLSVLFSFFIFILKKHFLKLLPASLSENVSEIIIHTCTCALKPKLVRHLSVSLDAYFEMPHFDDMGLFFL